MNTAQKVKCGTYVTDRRTGQVLRLTEYGRGTDVMVKPAYKSDGYWTSMADLELAKDPHAWGWKQVVFALIALAIGVFTGFNVGHDLVAHGFSAGDAVWYSLPSGVLATWLVGILTGISRA